LQISYVAQEAMSGYKLVCGFQFIFWP